jgi:putative tricarboxylic transport membrane protein
VVLQNWRMVAAAPGLNDEQKARVAADFEALAWSMGWQDQLAAKGWADTYLAGADFEAQLQSDIAATETILKGIGLVK